MNLYAVIGKPILHSLSPAMHNAALEALNLPARYVRLAVDDARAAFLAADHLALKGFNVTSPFKEDVARLVPYSDSSAEYLQAANCVVHNGRGWEAFNTDPHGVAGALTEAGCKLEGRAVVLGAGGAGRAAAHALETYGLQVTIANRTLSKAQRAAHRLECESCALGSEEFRGAVREARIIVDATTTKARLINPDDLAPEAFVLSARYPADSALVRDATAAGCTLVDGRRWLLHQGEEAFRVFTGREAPEGRMDKALGKKPEPRGLHLALVGFMGVGKSSVAREVAKRLELKSFDTDALVARRVGCDVPRLLIEKGERALRKQEALVVGELQKKGAVIACGGGLVTLPATARALRATTRLIVWLWARPETCLERIGDTTTRPLLGSRPLSMARNLLEGRLGQYATASDVVVDTEGRTAAQIADQIVALWREVS